MRSTPVALHFGHGLADEGTPIAHPYVYRKPFRSEKRLERRRLLARPRGERRPASDVGVALFDFLGQLGSQRPAAAHQGQVLRDILQAVRRAVGEQEDGLLHGRNSRTICTTAFTASTGVSGRMPWPVLKMCPGRVPVRFSSSVTLIFNSGRGAKSAPGSRFP